MVIVQRLDSGFINVMHQNASSKQRTRKPTHPFDCFAFLCMLDIYYGAFHGGSLNPNTARLRK